MLQDHEMMQAHETLQADEMMQGNYLLHAYDILQGDYMLQAASGPGTENQRAALQGG